MSIEIIKPYDEERQKKLSKESAQNFDKTKIEITKAGKTYNVYDSIQAQREDTEIYPTLEKYGNLEKMERPANENLKTISEIMTIGDLMIQDRKLQEFFEDLPSKERNKFDNNFYLFKKNGLSYYQKLAKEEIKKANELKKRQEEIKSKPIKVEVTNAETKN